MKYERLILLLILLLFLLFTHKKLFLVLIIIFFAIAIFAPIWDGLSDILKGGKKK